MKAIFKREFEAYFKSPLGYLFLGLFLAFSSLVFMMTNVYYGTTIMTNYFVSICYIFIFAVPLLTMKMFSEEQKLKTDQLLLTSPVKVTEIYAAAANGYDGNYGHDVKEDENLLPYVTFYREACEFKGCGHSDEAPFTSSSDKPNFYVHLNPFDLIIKKNGADPIDENQSFIFRVEGNGMVLDVIVQGNNSAKVVSLPVGDGEYTVTELIDWSWRYEVANSGSVTQNVDLRNYKAADGPATITFNNTRNNILWLDGDCYCENLWTGTSSISKKEEYTDPTKSTNQ